MDKREKKIRLWFEMWLTKTDMGIKEIFSDNVVYAECWGPEYHGVDKVKLWFDECITRQDVLKWDVQQVLHKDNLTIVLWYFQYQYTDESKQAFEGISVINWTGDDKIAAVKEYGCREHRYDPYKNGETPQFEDII